VSSFIGPDNFFTCSDYLFAMSSHPKEYFLLHEPASGYRIFDLLGRAVFVEKDSLKRPTEAIIVPELPKASGRTGPNLKTLVPSLYPRHVKAENVEVLLSKARNQEAQLAMSNLLDIFYSHDKANQRERSMTGFRRITMEEQSLNIEELLKNDAYSGPIINFFHKTPEAKLGVIVSIISCFKMEVGNKQSKESAGGMAAKIPGDAVGAPGADIKAKGKAGSSTDSELSGTYKDEVIMACSYVEMRLKDIPNKGLLSRLWRKQSKPSIHDITFTTSVSGKTLTETVYVSPARMKGDMERILGGIDQSDGIEAAGTAEPEQLKEDDESDFVVYV
jgi:hypothetical protein